MTLRIGLDLHALQAPSCRGRGIGRYARALLAALRDEGPRWEWVLYRRADLALDWGPELDPPRAEWVTIDPDPPGALDGTLQTLVQTNPQCLDWLLLLNPLVERRGFAIPETVPGGPRLAALVHDLIPDLFPRHYLEAPGLAAEYARDLQRLRPYDLILANSASTALDVVDRLGLPPRRVADIRAGADFATFRPAANPAEAEADARTLQALGLDGPFLYYLGNVDWRKNIPGLVDAYALLPADLQARLRLVVTCGDHAWFLGRLRRQIAAHGLGDRVVLTGPAADETVRALYRRAELFVSPSLYEGFGLPTLEALASGAAVLAADNSSQPEVVGPAGVLAPTGDPAAWAATITALVRDPDRLDALRRAGPEQAARFSWTDSARRLIQALETADARARPRRASPWALIAYPSPDEAGFDPEAGALFDRLGRGPGAVAFTDLEEAAALPPLPARCGWQARRLLGRVAPVLGLRRAVYLVDAVDDLDPLLADLATLPGVVLFAGRRTDRPTDLVRGRFPSSAIDEALRKVLRRALAVACRSDALRARLTRLALASGAGPVLRLDPRADPPEAPWARAS